MVDGYREPILEPEGVAEQCTAHMEEVFRQYEDRCVGGVVGYVFLASLLVGQGGYAEALRRMDEKRELGRRGGKKNARSIEEKITQYDKWEAEIEARLTRPNGRKISQVMRELEIPSSTYYEYRKVAQKHQADE